MSRLSSLFLNKNNDSDKYESSSQNDPVPQKYRVLFVDDEENVLKSILRIFRKENYIVYTASSGDEALERLKENPVNVIISDHRMPGMTGADLLRKIKEMYPHTIRIMLTGNADVNAIMGAINDGAVYKFITKPWNDEDLRLTVSLALEQYDLLQENIYLKKQQNEQKKKISQLSRLVDANRSQLGRILLNKNLIAKDQLETILEEQSRTKKVIPAVLTDLKLFDEKTIMKIIHTELNISRVSPSEFTVPVALTSLIPREICEKNVLVPLKKSGNSLMVAMADPTDYLKIEDLKFITGIPVQAVLASCREITDKLTEIYGCEKSLGTAVSEFEIQDPSESIEIIIEEDEEADINELLSSKDSPPAIMLVNSIISDALRHSASDVHIEPKTKYAMVRYRIDGLLVDKIHYPLHLHPSIVSRIKIMSELDISERRRPQDGRVTVKTSIKTVDMRISTLPTINGEKIVLRILDKNASIKDIKELGISEADIKRVSLFMSQPQGILLITGPTGSGKTSTLYSLLQQGATITKNITTIEDPVEYFMSMAQQVSVRGKIGLNFPLVLRALLRQDPNIIMLGEIRDFETAEVAFHAALTGHLVLTTLHTNGTISTITRLRDMGIKPYVISDSLTGIIAQRLVRKICPDCKIDDNPSEELLNALKLSRKTIHFTPKKGKGCYRCDQTGYIGRTGLFEVFQMDEEIKKMIHRDATETELLKAARWSGMKTILEDAIIKIEEGHTTCEEVLRVLGAQNMIEIECGNCHQKLGDLFSYCPFCGEKIIPACSNCRNFMDQDWLVCPNCGNKKEVNK